MKRAAPKRNDPRYVAEDAVVEDDDAHTHTRTAGAAATAEGASDEELVFEDPYEDEEEESDSDVDADEEMADDADALAKDAGGRASVAVTAGTRAAGGIGAVVDDEDGDEDDDEANDGPKSVWRPGVDDVAEGEELEVEMEAYVMLHEMAVEWPCLSFDCVPDRLGAARTKFPLACTLVAGTQADRPADNKLLVMRLSSLHKTQNDAKDDDSVVDSDESDCDDDPEFDAQRIQHTGGVNRVRTMPQDPHIVATMADTGAVHLFDIRPQLRILDAGEGKGAAAPVPRGYGPVFSFRGHRAEGYAVDWSPTVPGRLVTGDCAANIHVWEVDSTAAARAMGPGENGLSSSTAVDLEGIWKVNPDAPYTSHAASVEDLQWSPTEATVFASASVDGSVRIWDTRARSHAMLTVQASTTDVNAINWSKLVSFLMVSGDDAGTFKIWDLRRFDSDSVIAKFDWHRKQITSVEWAYDDENVLAVASADNTVTMWDMSLEHDDDAELAMARAQAAAAGTKRANAMQAVPSSRDPTLAGIPPQLLFIHGVRSQLKEVHFHRQLPGVLISTSADGFNIFKPDVVVTT